MKERLLVLAMVILITSYKVSAQWEVTTGPSQPNVVSLATSETNTFAAAGTSLSYTSNNGTDWSFVSNGLTGYILSVTTKGTDVFVGASGGAVFQSANNGSSWTNTSTGLPSYDIRGLTVDGSDLYAGSWGVYKSTDNGLQWTQVHQDWYGQVYSIAITNDTIIASTKNTGIHLTFDNGANWSNVNTGLTFPVSSVTIIGTTFLAGTNDGLFRSTNGGLSWSPTSITSAICGFTKVGIHVFAASCGGEGVFISSDNGVSWTAINTGLSNMTVYSLATNSTHIFAGTSGYVFRRLLSDVLPLPTSIEEENNDFASVYPNPSDSKFIISTSRVCNFKIFNGIGQLVSSQKNFSGQKELDLKVSGNYFLLMEDEISNEISKKHIILR
jgi:hypothetical protein